MKVLSTKDSLFEPEWKKLCARGSRDDEGPILLVVGRTVGDVRARGDAALFELTERFDGWRPRDGAAITAGAPEFEAAFASLPREGQAALRLAAKRIADFHERERDAEVPPRRDRQGSTLGQVTRPLGRVGLYVPGGTARYPSTVLMTAIPARIAGVAEVFACSPAMKPAEAGGAEGVVDAWTLAACHVAGVARLFKVGGAQAVAALAYGTATIPAVDKICGPGNAYVTAAKRLVFGTVDIDMLAGPTEIAVVAAPEADPAECAADLLAQAEHDVRAVAVLFTPSAQLAAAVEAEVKRQLETLPRRAIAERSVEDRGALIVTRDLAEAVRLADEFAPEHLALLVPDAQRWVPRIARAGAVFAGSHTPEAVGDYVAGPSHVLPTAGTARFASPLSVATFRRRMSVVDFSPRALAQVAPAVEALAAAEGLEGHARAVRMRVAAAGAVPARRRPAARRVKAAKPKARARARTGGKRR
ncbi:MAG: histidinol dehydrogenase [Deltaproteobacteria bacterium]|nr:histidinol dehydrogenase [Deltaproteobacteria bacterium]